ncbi:MAG: excinuclease ABC subunit UvrB [Candidatus Atribacteria bacterium]|nr:excinuclease ABC subunit UvrB [Candidatus Atribacteria bacterium]
MPTKGCFQLVSDYQPRGDQPTAIEKLKKGISNQLRFQTLLGVTGSGKTFTMANVIQYYQRPTLIISPNKTLAAQLYSEMKAFFPNNAVEYFVSYYDYYQPEAYVPEHDLYIEKDASINEQIDRLRLSATSALMERNDVVVVASVSCIYGIGSPEEYRKRIFHVRIDDTWTRDTFAHRLVDLLYERNEIEFTPCCFRMKGDTIEIYPAYSETAIRFEFWGNRVESIKIFEPVSGKTLNKLPEIFVYPAKHYLVDRDQFDFALRNIELELQDQLKTFLSQGKLIEADRLEKRTRYDLEMLRATFYCSGIENYSRHLDGRKPGEPPYTLIDYFPQDFLLFIDESHVAIPQIHGMLAGDRSRKKALVDFGFRLPSCFDNRPLSFKEFEAKLGYVVYVSATPGTYEYQKSDQIVEQLIRPTGLIDPKIIIRPATGQVDDLFQEIKQVIQSGERVLVTTLTKRSAEDLCDYLFNLGIKVRYLHSEIETIERARIIRDLRAGEFDVLVGINLLREGLDLPEVALVAVLDADKEGFLRSEVSLIQTIGRAARNIKGRAILYADRITGSLERAIQETERRRKTQLEYNRIHHITPESIIKEVRTLIPEMVGLSPEAENTLYQLDQLEADQVAEENLIERLTQEMKKAAQNLEFEKAALIRDELIRLKKTGFQTSEKNIRKQRKTTSRSSGQSYSN